MSTTLKFKDRVILSVAPPIAGLVIRALAAPMKLKFLNEDRVRPFWEKDERFIAAFWHNRLLLMGYSYHGKGIKILISQHKDGELIARVLKRLGFGSVRGSSTRGGAAAMREMVRAAG